jgi:arginyl-tRNA synthetase
MNGVSKMATNSLTQFELVQTKDVGKAVSQIKEAFDKKHILEKSIAKLIKDYEEGTGFAIDMIKYQRDITLPVRGSHYTSLNIIIQVEEQ